MITEIEIDHSVETDKDKILDLTIGDNHKTDAYNVDMTVGEEVIEVRIIIEMTVEIENIIRFLEIIKMFRKLVYRFPLTCYINPVTGRAIN